MMYDYRSGIEERRFNIRKALQYHRMNHSSFESVAKMLEGEPEAKHRRLRSYAKINIDDVAGYSELLKKEFPDLIYFFANYKTGTPTPSKFRDDVAIILFPSLYHAVLASMDVEKERPAFNGPNFNRPDIYCRWPWPEETASADPERLIGGRDTPDDVFRLALQYRDEGRWFSFHFRGDGYVDPRQPNLRYRLSVLDRSKLPTDAYPEMAVLTGGESEFFAVYDLNDPVTTAFAKRAHALWRRIATKVVAVYDPIVGKIVEPSNWSGRHRRSIGKRALEGALKTPPRYADFAFTPLDGYSEGPALMIGPKLRKPKSKAR